MRTNFARFALLAATIAGVAGCQTNPYNRLSMRNLWPWGRKEASADSALASSAPAEELPTRPSTVFTPGSTGPTNPSYSTNPYAAVASAPSYPETSTSQSAQTGYQSYGTASQPYGTTAGGAQGYETAAYNTNGSAQPSGYNESYGQSAGATGYANPSGYTAPATDSQPTGTTAEYISTQTGMTGDSRYGSPAAGSTGPQYSGRYGEPASAAPGYDTSYSGGSAAGTTAYPTDVQYPSTGAASYQPGQSDYVPGDTGYSPPGVQAYQSPAGSYDPYSDPGAAEPHYRPGGTSDYVPGSAPATGTSAASGQPQGAVPSLLTTPGAANPVENTVYNPYGATPSYGAGTAPAAAPAPVYYGGSVSSGGTYQP